MEWLKVLAHEVGPVVLVLTLIIFWLLALITRLMGNVAKLSASNAKMITLLEVLVHGSKGGVNDGP